MTVDLVSAAIGFFSTQLFAELTEAAVFSWVSGRIGTSDGTRAARSGGWSFPTGGLAYNKQFFFNKTSKHATKNT